MGLKFEDIAGPVIGAVQTAANLFTQNANRKRQQRHNREMAQLQHGHNMELLKYQLDYNTPSAQMQRYKDAGLNPNLVYSQGSPGNMQSAPSYPNIQTTDQSIELPNLLSMYQQIANAKLLETQADLNQIKGNESVQKQDLMRAQENLVLANPYLNKTYMEALVQSLESKASMLQTQNRTISEIMTVTTGEGTKEMPMLMVKAEQEINALLQRNKILDLQSSNLETDNKIKAEVLKSKSFQNDMDAVFNGFLKNSQMDGESFRRIIIMFLSKLAR